MLRVVTLSTLFPNPVQPNFGVFVENQTLRLAACDDVELRVVNPIPMPLPPLDRLPHYAKLRTLPLQDVWKGVPVARPRMRVIPRLSAPLNPALLVRAARPVLRRWREEGFRFDVIDAQFFFPDGPAARVLAAEFGVPFSVKARGADIHYWGNRAGCRGQVRRAAAEAHGMLAVAASLRRDMIGMGMDGERIAVHYTGVDLERFRPQDRVAAKARLGIAGPLVISLGALIPRKGHDIVIEAVADIPGATLLVAGDGPDRAKLQALAESRGVADRVRLLGSVPHAELPAMLAAADVMALASASEGLANAWIEAMACGTPVVTPEVDGAAEAVDRPAAGRLLRQRTPAAFAAAIREILADPPAQAAVRESAERFNWRHNTEQLHRHLHKLAG
ncbi:glycosyltransferase [Roseomonas haemaphysalidis]|uniref:Glycosyltransferase n=1 Tax=Roseomonas haemaphysalidis TaxID=2768162 RepID=A0ABS3KR11_9PROT|nr:glycosyltransferase [Roseomonas haemaphysalidis]MBO1079023.1 glycosyltransferase [Roseomonas haemaphysalidis]